MTPAGKLMIARRADPAYLMSLEMGKSLTDARGAVTDAAAPFGGVKQSGIGREGGYDSIEAHLETTYVATNR